MPHQCLKCGRVYDDGASQLLKGCSECKGTRFFYTKKPLTEEERAKLLSQMEKDVSKVLSGCNNNKMLDTKNMEAMINQGLKKRSEDLEYDTRRSNPETILIERTGRYIIDVKGLLEYEPVIVHKDGVYTIHLPSVFRMINKKKM